MKHNELKFTILIFIIFCNFFCVDAVRIKVNGPIDEKEFMDRTDIDEVEFEEGCGVTEIPDYAFLGCKNLKKVILPGGLKKIGFQSFSECSSLREINLPSSLEDIGSNSFTYCSKLKKVDFPFGLKHIGHNAFSFCTSLKSVSLPSSIEELESYAFSDCDLLEVAILPANGKMLGELIFNCCGSLKIIVELSHEVPSFDCDSYIFDPDDKDAYRRCKLFVKADMEEFYSNASGWSLFENIATISQR